MTVTRVDVNFLDRAVVTDPFPVYEQIRDAGRVVWNDALHAWMVPGFDDCTTILTDSGERFRMAFDDREMIPWFEAPNMIQVDGGEHKRLRRRLVAPFTRNAIAKWEKYVGEVVDQLLTPLLDGSDEFDLADFTMIPTVIVARMLGVPEARYDDFRRWSHAISSNIAFGREDPVRREAMLKIGQELNGYLAQEIGRRRDDEFDDLLGLMLRSSDHFNEDEVRSTAVLLLVAGYDTTAKLMSSCLVALEQHPDQRRLLTEDPTLIPAAVEEVLRWEGVNHATPRLVVRDTELADTRLSAGDLVFALLSAANRDPGRWPDPGRFDIRREAKAHVAFGFGRHLCLGAYLARLETTVALERLLRIAPEYRLRDVGFGGAISRGPESGFVNVR